MGTFLSDSGILVKSC